VAQPCSSEQLRTTEGRQGENRGGARLFTSRENRGEGKLRRVLSCRHQGGTHRGNGHSEASTAAVERTCGRSERRWSFELGEEAAHERGRARSCLQVEEMAERAGGGLSRGRARG
jgi:hypothetical protein